MHRIYWELFILCWDFGIKKLQIFVKKSNEAIHALLNLIILIIQIYIRKVDEIEFEFLIKNIEEH